MITAIEQPRRGFRNVLRNRRKPKEMFPLHLTQSIALEESPLPHMLRSGVTLIGGLLFLFMLWAAFTSIEEVASASGEVVPTGYVQSVQHLEGGIVKEILVHEGDLVEAGQVLIRLDDTSAGADLGQMQARRDALLAQADRFRRFTKSANAKGNQAVMSEDGQAILRSMEESRTSQRSVLNDQIAQKQNEIGALASTRQALEKNIALLRKENTIRQNLASKGYGSELMAMTSQRAFNDMEGQLAEARGQQLRARASLDEAQIRLESLNADLNQQALKNLADVEAQLAEVNETLGKYKSAASRTVVTSPVRGLVKGLSVHTIGAVVEQGKLLLEIVPIEEELMVEALISPRDVGHLKAGQKVKVKVSAFDYSRYGSVPGHLASVSATTFQGQDQNSFYKARIKLDRPYVGGEAEHNLIMPGMTIQADIVTGEKSILQYLLKPIYVATEEGFHEN